MFSRYEEDCLRNKKREKSESQPRELPRMFKEKIKELNGCEEKFVMQKELFKSDISLNNARFSIPPKKLVDKFLTETEESFLDVREEENKTVPSIPVLVLDPSLREYNLLFKKWDMMRSSVYNLATGWNQILHHNNFKVDDTMQLWSFRVSSQLCFALVKL
uniref:B3 domain-containing protein At3g25182 family n=2 Tax=Cajanus cajan TaxID=3821 RepID=A0A151U255_CAJCA|nr:B3 domain-containing protein At3g25182 family [Cajanus cajan]